MNTRLIWLVAVALFLPACGQSAAPSLDSQPIPGGRPSIEVPGGIYVTELFNKGPNLFGYPDDNRRNGGPNCFENLGQGVGRVTVDAKGDAIVTISAQGVSRVYVFRGPGMCGPLVGSVDPIGLPVDAAGVDAAHGKFVVADLESSNGGPGFLITCTLAAGCTAALSHPNMNFLLGVALATNGDCWVSAEGNDGAANLTYFKDCAGSGVGASGYKNLSGGGLDIDKNGNLVSIDPDQGLWVYKGCKPRCAVVGGPFYLRQAQYGHLNENSTEFAAADAYRGAVDIYKYGPTRMTYEYSFDSGLSRGAELQEAAFNPRSRE